MFYPEPLPLPHFPPLDTLQTLLKVSCQHPVFYDIETTGLSKDRCHIYLIGALAYEKKSWTLRQWFADDEEEEKIILSLFLSWIAGAGDSGDKRDLLIHFNGDSFDLPFIKTRCQIHGLDCGLPDIPCKDLYRGIRPLKSLLKLTSLKAEKLEAFCQSPTREYPNGKNCLSLYRQYLSGRDSSIRSILLGHNKEDLVGMGEILRLLSYRQLGEGSYEEEREPILLSTAPAPSIRFFLLSDLPVPRAVNISFEDMPELSILWEKRSCRVDIALTDGRLKLFHADVKNYDYLPREDSVIPKSLSSFLDRSHRVPATKQNCYTWFPCTEDFIMSEENHRKYLASLFARLEM